MKGHFECISISIHLNVYSISIGWDSLVAQTVKNTPAMQETWVQPLGWEDSPGGGHGYPLWYSCLEDPHGQRRLVGYCPWGRKELYVIERLSTAQQDTNIATWWLV